MILGKNTSIIERKSNNDSVSFKGNEIIITFYKRSAASLLKEFLSNLLYSQLVKIYTEIKREGKVEVFGDLDFKVMSTIDKKKRRALLP
ncbi:MAG: hypothetical protein QXX95_06920 [Nitrososphaerales archaeon]